MTCKFHNVHDCRNAASCIDARHHWLRIKLRTDGQLCLAEQKELTAFETQQDRRA